MSVETFGTLGSISCENFRKRPKEYQKLAVLLLLENGLSPDKIRKKADIYRDEYNALFDGSLPLYKLEDDE